MVQRLQILTVEDKRILMHDVLRPFMSKHVIYTTGGNPPQLWFGKLGTDLTRGQRNRLSEREWLCFVRVYNGHYAIYYSDIFSKERHRSFTFGMRLACPEEMGKNPASWHAPLGTRRPVAE